jgi:signal peptidase II
MGSALVTELAATGQITWSIRRLFAMLGLITLPILGLDQLTKGYVASNIRLYSSYPIIPNWLDVTYTLNPGAAFSFFSTMPALDRQIFFLALSCIATVVLLVLIARASTSLSSCVGFAMVLGGTLGNFIDRLVRGQVVDFIFFHHDWFSYPVFNVADSAITIGVAIILITSILGGRDRSVS